MRGKAESAAFPTSVEEVVASFAREEIVLVRMGLGFTLLALVACAPQYVAVVPEALQDFAPLPVRVDPHLFALTERWVSGGTAGDVPVGEWLRQALADDPRARSA